MLVISVKRKACRFSKNSALHLQHGFNRSSEIYEAVKNLLSDERY